MTTFLHSFTLPEGVTPTIAGLVVGIVTATIGFLIVAWVTRPRMRPERIAVAVEPYDIEPPRVVVTPPPVLPPIERPIQVDVAPSFRPSTQLSARALAKMGIPVAPFGERDIASYIEAPTTDPDGEDPEATHYERGHAPDSKGRTLRMSFAELPPLPPPPPVPVISGTPIAVISSEPAASPSVSESAMRPLAPSSSGMLLAATPAAAPIDELDFEDAKTQAANPPRRSSSSIPAAPRPKIRRVTPVPPRRTG